MPCDRITNAYRRVPLLALSSSAIRVPAAHCWTSQQWHPFGCLVSLVALSAMFSVYGAEPAQAADSYADQRARLETMSAEEKEQLQRKKERFEALSEAEQKRLRELHAEVASAPESDELLAVMTRYNEWLKTLSSAVRAELLSLPPDERIKRIKEIKQDQERQRFREFANNLPERDMNIVYSWIEEFVGRNEEAYLERTPGEFRRRLQQMNETERRKALVGGLIWRRWDDDSPKPSEIEISELLPQLSEETRREVARATTNEEKLLVIRTLVRAAVLSKVLPPITDEQRQQVFAKLSSVERERLEQMAPDMMRRELTRMYHAQQFRERDGWRGWGPPGSGGPRFGPGRRDDGRDGPREGRGEGGRDDRRDGPRGEGRREFGRGERPEFGPPPGPPRRPPPMEEPPMEPPAEEPAADAGSSGEAD